MSSPHFALAKSIYYPVSTSTNLNNALHIHASQTFQTSACNNSVLQSQIRLPSPSALIAMQPEPIFTSSPPHTSLSLPLFAKPRNEKPNETTSHHTIFFFPLLARMYQPKVLIHPTNRRKEQNERNVGTDLLQLLLFLLQEFGRKRCTYALHCTVHAKFLPVRQCDEN